jgi:hypothetical protein
MLATSLQLTAVAQAADPAPSRALSGLSSSRLDDFSEEPSPHLSPATVLAMYHFLDPEPDQVACVCHGSRKDPARLRADLKRKIILLSLRTWLGSASRRSAVAAATRRYFAGVRAMGATGGTPMLTPHCQAYNANSEGRQSQHNCSSNDDDVGLSNRGWVGRALPLTIGARNAHAAPHGTTGPAADASPSISLSRSARIASSIRVGWPFRSCR